ncbi:MAG: hypothetical protein QW514_09705 [Thermoprotei archaeon]
MPQTTVKLKVTSLDGYPVKNAYANIGYIIGNESKSINFPATDARGQTNITFPINQSINAHLNVTFLGTIVLKNYGIRLAPNTTLSFNLTVNVVNLTYAIENPKGGLLSSATISFRGVQNTNVSSVSVSTNSPSGSILLPTGLYSISAYRGPLFYNENLTISYSYRTLNITAPLLTLKYLVVGVNNKPAQAQAVDLLYAGSVLNSSMASVGSFQGLLPGYYQMVVFGSGLTNSTTVAVGSNVSVKIMLPIGYDVSFKFSNEFGLPLVGYNVTLVGSNSYSNITNAAGIARFTGLPQGEYIIEVYNHGHLEYITTSYVDASGYNEIIVSNPAANTSALSAYTVVRLVFGVILIILATLILLTTRTKSK